MVEDMLKENTLGDYSLYDYYNLNPFVSFFVVDIHLSFFHKTIFFR